MRIDARDGAAIRDEAVDPREGAGGRGAGAGRYQVARTGDAGGCAAGVESNPSDKDFKCKTRKDARNTRHARRLIRFAACRFDVRASQIRSNECAGRLATSHRFLPLNLSPRSVMAKKPAVNKEDLKRRQGAPLVTPTDLKAKATRDIAGGMNAILADVFALYLKTKNFHWHMSGPHFRDYHLLLDEQADQLYAMTDPIAERIRKVGGSTLRSIGHIARTQRMQDNDAEYVEPLDMLAELREDNKTLAATPARSARRVRRAPRHRQRQPDRELDRRDRTAHLVPVRGEPSRRRHRSLTRAHGEYRCRIFLHRTPPSDNPHRISRCTRRPTRPCRCRSCAAVPVILVFYPADWSPVCGDQVSLYNELLSEFRRYDAAILGISVDGVWCHSAFAQRSQAAFSAACRFRTERRCRAPLRRLRGSRRNQRSARCS